MGSLYYIEARADRYRSAQLFDHTRGLTLSEGALRALLDYQWPGNVRELERLIEHVVALAETSVIELDDLPPSVRSDYTDILLPSFKRRESLKAWACRYAHLMLEHCQGNRRETARILGISYHTLKGHLKYPEARASAESGRKEPSPSSIAEVCVES